MAKFSIFRRTGRKFRYIGDSINLVLQHQYTEAQIRAMLMTAREQSISTFERKCGTIDTIETMIEEDRDAKFCRSQLAGKEVYYCLSNRIAYIYMEKG